MNDPGCSIPMGRPVDVDARCIVCGSEYTIAHHVLVRAARCADDGSFVQPGDVVRTYFSDGRVAASCSSHTADEVRTAYVLTEWKLTEERDE